MRLKLILFLLLLTSLLYSCESIFGEDEPELPPITTTGADTFGCKIDGKVFVPYFKSFMTSTALYAGESNNKIDISVWNSKWGKNNNDCSNSKVYLFFKIDSSLNVENQGSISFVECDENNSEGRKAYRADIFQNQTRENSFEILKNERIDQYEILLSGTFRAVVESEDGIIRKIRNGRFDVKIWKPVE